MRIGKLVLSLAVLAFASSLAVAQEAPPSALAKAIDNLVDATEVAAEKADPWTPAFTLKVVGRTKYITQNGYATGPAVQEQLTASWDCGAYVDLFLSNGTNDREFSSDFADEQDYTLGYLGSLSGLGIAADFDAGLSYVNLVELSAGRGDQLNPYLDISKTFKGKWAWGQECYEDSLKLECWAEDYLSLYDYKHRWFFGVAATYTLALPWQRMTFSHCLELGCDNGSHAQLGDSGYLPRYRAELALPLNQKGTVLAVLGYDHIWVRGGMQDREAAGSFDLGLTIQW